MLTGTMGIKPDPLCKSGFEEETGIHILFVWSLYISTRHEILEASNLDINQINHVKLGNILEFINVSKRCVHPRHSGL